MLALGYYTRSIFLSTSSSSYISNTSIILFTYENDALRKMAWVTVLGWSVITRVNPRTTEIRGVGGAHGDLRKGMMCQRMHFQRPTVLFLSLSLSSPRLYTKSTHPR